jgi:hypothetical protein
VRTSATTHHDVTRAQGADDALGEHMKIRGHGNGLAIALAGLAVVIAGSGTAYAVTTTVVNIADPTVPSRVAKVDPLGRLSTFNPPSTVNVVGAHVTNSARYAEIYSAPTSAPLAVTKFSVTSTGVAGTYAVSLFQVPVNADGTCSTTSVSRTLGYAVVSPGTSGVQDFPSGLTVAPVSGGTQYCLDLYAGAVGSAGAAGEQLYFQITAYAGAGRYTGTGAAAPDGPAPTPHSKAAAVGGR